MIVRMQLLKAPQVAEILNISVELVYLWMRRGILPTVREGRVVRVPSADLERWIQAKTAEGRQLEAAG